MKDQEIMETLPLKKLSDGNKTEELREWNLRELSRFDWLDWDNPSRFTYSVINALLSTMGVSASNSNMEKVIRYAFGDADLDKRTGNTGFTIEYGPDNSFRTMVPVESLFIDNAFDVASPLVVRLLDCKGNLEITISDKATISAKVKKAPSWYNKKYRVGEQDFYGSKFVQWENNVLMMAIPGPKGRQVCAYLVNPENACKFCGLQQGAYKPLTPEILADIVRQDLEETGSTSITMTGGNLFTRNRGFEKYIPFVERVRSEFGNDIPIELEVSPPKDKEFVDWIVKMNLLVMSNLEVWYEKYRQFIIPAKAREIPKQEYLNTFRYLNERGIVTSSVLITSLQPYESILEGTEELAKAGTTTVILPYRPTGGVLQQYTPSTATDLLKASIASAKIMQKYGVFLDSRTKSCCSGCGGCGVDANIRDNPIFRDLNYEEFLRRGEND